MTDDEKNLRTFELEKSAMTGDHSAVVELVSDYRLLRQKIEWLRNLQYRDGTIDGVNAHQFFSEVEDILNGPQDE